MNPVLGTTLALLMIGASYQSYGWQGVAFAGSAIVFWLLLQFNRALRVMKNASRRPLGFVASAAMFQSRLKAGMTMLQVVAETKSLGRKCGEAVDGAAQGEDWAWADAGGEVRLHFERGRLVRWTLERHDAADSAVAEAG